MNNIDNEEKRLLEESKRRHEQALQSAVDNSVGVVPVSNKRRKKAVEKGKKIISSASALLILMGGIAIGVGAEKVSENYENRLETGKAYSILIEDYPDLVEEKHIPGEYTIYYEHSKIANNIKAECLEGDGYNAEKFDEAVYAAWLFMTGEDFKKPELATSNMEKVFDYLGYNISFQEYLQSKGFINENGELDVSSYSDSMREKVVREENARERGMR